LVPSQGGFGLDDQECISLPGPVHCRAEYREDCSVGVGEAWSAGLAFQNEDLVAKSQDLSVTGVAGDEEPSESAENEAHESRKEGQERKTLPASPMPERR